MCATDISSRRQCVGWWTNNPEMVSTRLLRIRVILVFFPCSFRPVSRVVGNSYSHTYTICMYIVVPNPATKKVRSTIFYHFVTVACVSYALQSRVVASGILPDDVPVSTYACNKRRVFQANQEPQTFQPRARTWKRVKNT